MAKAGTIYKLTYFNIRARAEPARFIFAYAKVPYEDVRLDREKWPSIKYTFPWDQVPILEVNGKILTQSIAIARYLGRTFNLVGENEFEAAKCDEYVDALMDSRVEWKKVHFEPDQAKKVALKKELLEKHFSRYFSKFEAIATKNKSAGDYLVGKKITWADLTVASTLEFYQDTLKEPGLLDDYKNLKGFKDAVFNIPQIKEWVSKRPKTAM